MNALTTTWRQLVRRRLWPVALLLLAALAAVPFLLAHDPKPVVAPGVVPGPTAKGDDAVAEPVVAKATPEDRDRRRRVLGVTKDPFEPAPLPKPKTKKKKKAATTTAPNTGQAGKPTGTGGTSAPVAPSFPGTTVTLPVTPAPKAPTYPKGSVIVRFGDATGDHLARKVVKKLAPLPNHRNPLLVYMGLTDHGKKAVFLIDDSLQPTGDGTCKPHPSNCERIELAKGETEFFDVTDPASGAVTAQYELDLVAIK